jgi:hypothetical protein
VTIHSNDPGSLAAARSTVCQEVQEDLDGMSTGNYIYSANDILANVAGAAGFSSDLANEIVMAAQRLGNGFGR